MNKNEQTMDSISIPTHYDIENVADENVADYINALGNATLADNRIIVAQKSVENDAIVHFNNEQYVIEDRNKSEQAHDWANDSLKKIDVNTLSNDDYEKMINATINNADPKHENTLDSICERSAILRHIVGHTDDKQMHALLNAQSPSAQARFIEDAKIMYPEAMPSQEQVDAYKKDIKEALLNGKPRPETMDVKTISDNIRDKANVVYENNVDTARKQQAAEKAAATRRFSNSLSGMSDISSPANTFDY